MSSGMDFKDGYKPDEARHLAVALLAAANAAEQTQ